MGRPRSTLASRFWPKVKKGDGCWEWTGFRFSNGYGSIRKPGDNGRALTHRVAYELSFGPIPPGLLVCHHCDNRKCVRPDHLFLGTHADNSRDMAEKGHQGRKKLSPTEILKIRTARASGVGPTELGRRYGVNKTTIVHAVQRKTWRHVP